LQGGEGEPIDDEAWRTQFDDGARRMREVEGSKIYMDLD
jgi:hypothetical protein